MSYLEIRLHQLHSKYSKLILWDPTAHLLISLSVSKQEININCNKLCTRRYLWILVSIHSFKSIHLSQKDPEHRTLLYVSLPICHRSTVTLNWFYRKQYSKEASCIRSLMSDCVLLKIVLFTPPQKYCSLVTTDEALQQGTCCDTGWHAAGANPVLWTQWLILRWCSGWYWLSLPLLSLTSSRKLGNEILERDRPL